MQLPFSPSSSTVNINVAAASANVLVTNADGEEQIRVMNNGTATVWVAFGTDNTIVATVAGSMPVGPGTCQVLTRGRGPVWAAAIAAGATGKVYFTPGEGL